MRHILMVASLFAMYAGVSTAEAQTRDWTGWHASVAVGAAEGREYGDASYDSLGLKPKGPVLNASVGRRFAVADTPVVVGFDVDGQIGKVEASAKRASCNLFDCGFDEIETQKRGSHFSVGMGGSVGVPVGPVLVSATAGLRMGDYTREYGYTSRGFYPDYFVEETGFRAGIYYGARGEFVVRDDVLVRLEFRRSELTEIKIKGTDWRSDSVFKSNEILIGLVHTF